MTLAALAVPSRSVQGGREHFRRIELAAHPRKHSTLWESFRKALYEE